MSKSSGQEAQQWMSPLSPIDWKTQFPTLTNVVKHCWSDQIKMWVAHVSLQSGGDGHGRMLIVKPSHLRKRFEASTLKHILYYSSYMPIGPGLHETSFCLQYHPLHKWANPFGSTCRDEIDFPAFFKTYCTQAICRKKSFFIFVNFEILVRTVHIQWRKPWVYGFNQRWERFPVYNASGIKNSYGRLRLGDYHN